MCPIRIIFQKKNYCIFTLIEVEILQILKKFLVSWQGRVEYWDVSYPHVRREWQLLEFRSACKYCYSEAVYFAASKDISYMLHALSYAHVRTPTQLCISSFALILNAEILGYKLYIHCGLCVRCIFSVHTKSFIGFENFCSYPCR